MNKKFILAGFMFWAGLSGYMGLRVLESYTEDAVYAVLSVIPAQAQEIRFSFLTNSLSLKGIEYEIPHDTIVHKGTIERVEVKNFARKIMFVKPNMPAYNADELPRVGESFEFTGIVDQVHEGKKFLERRIGSLDIKGWHQRLGMLLDRYHRDGMTAPFFEELYRMRVDELSASQLSFSMTQPELKAPITGTIDQLTIPGGIKAPRGEEKNTPMNLVLDRVSFGNGDGYGSAGRIEARDLLVPAPAMMEKVLALSDPKKEGEKVSSESKMDVLVEAYAERPPFSFASVQDLRLTPEKDGSETTLSSASYAIQYSGESYTDSIKINNLHIKPEQFGELSETIRKFSPEGLNISFSNEGKSDNTSFVSNSVAEVAELGKLESKINLDGDFMQLKALSATGELEKLDPFTVLNMLKIKEMASRYSDSGLLPLLITLMAQEMGEQPQAVAE
ncbi:MAG: hypothetical protein IKJ34_04595, partial [Mailhella sp.]|nr:hypothetical protein [Mailhella sp.]